MFSKADKNKAPATAGRAVPTLISNDLEISGNLKTSGEVQLDGTVEGDIVCGKLVIGEKAIIDGHIEADEVVIRGRVTGRVKARTVHLAKTAQVIGDIWHDSLAMEAGALLEGHCKRNDSSQASAAGQMPARAVSAAPLRGQAAVTAKQPPQPDNSRATVAKTAAGT